MPQSYTGARRTATALSAAWLGAHQIPLPNARDARERRRTARNSLAKPKPSGILWRKNYKTYMDTKDASVYNATVTGREEINPQLIILRVRPDHQKIDFKPGQFAVLGLLGSEQRVMEGDQEDPPPAPDKLIRRAYSIASASSEKLYLEFFVTLVASGELTPRLFNLKYGGRVFLSPKATGLFTLDRVAPHKSVVLVATGTGLAPYMSMLRTILVNETQRRFVVLHGARFSWDVGYRAELETLARIRPNLTYIPAITRPEADPHFHGQTGRIQTLLAAGQIEKLSGVPLDPAQTDVFLCGNPEMISAVKALLGDKGFVAGKGREEGTIHVEEYW